MEWFLVPYSQDYLGKDFYICAYGTLIGQFNIVGKEIIESVTTTSSTTTQVGSTIETVYTMEDSQADSYVSNLGDYAELGGEVATAVASAGQNGTASALSSGADKAFSSTTTVTTTSSSSVSNQKVKVSATGTITLEGKLVFETGTAISPLPINMYDVLNASANSTNSSLVYSPASTTGHNLGLWTLADIPEVSYSRVIRLSSYQATPAYPGATDQFMIRGTVSTPTVHGATPEVVFNPDVEPYITKKIISAEYMLCDKLEGEKYKEDVKDYLTIGESNLLYSDEDKAFYNVTPQQVTVPGPATMVRLHNPAGRGAFFFDWGEIEDARILAVVKVDVTFNYEGEEKHLVQTRVYSTRSIVDPQNEILLERYHIPENDSYVLNYGNPYYK